MAGFDDTPRGPIAAREALFTEVMHLVNPVWRRSGASLYVGQDSWGGYRCTPDDYEELARITARLFDWVERVRLVPVTRPTTPREQQRRLRAARADKSFRGFLASAIDSE